ncbi:MAG: PorT family protein [Flaviramulus sp.]|nr:porin family protein [Flaviramulus sp.]NNC50155.1 PorT family protein [Flaviramulus sp.]
MNRLLVIAVLLLSSLWSYTQENADKEIDSLYKEDQFYAGITYNLIGNQPKNLSQSGFSLGFHLGFIKDMPINDARNMAIGIGLGYSANSYNQNLLISKNNFGNVRYSVLDNSSTYTKNKLSTHILEVPIEFRWRTSTPTNYNFWRIYAGFKLGYVFANTSNYEGDLGSIKNRNLKDFNNLQYGFTISTGFNTWNLYVYYALNKMFAEEALINGDNIDMNAVKIGLMFYIL